MARRANPGLWTRVGGVVLLVSSGFGLLRLMNRPHPEDALVGGRRGDEILLGGGRTAPAPGTAPSEMPGVSRATRDAAFAPAPRADPTAEIAAITAALGPEWSRAAEGSVARWTKGGVVIEIELHRDPAWSFAAMKKARERGFRADPNARYVPGETLSGPAAPSGAEFWSYEITDGPGPDRVPRSETLAALAAGNGLPALLLRERRASESAGPELLAALEAAAGVRRR